MLRPTLKVIFLLLALSLLLVVDGWGSWLTPHGNARKTSSTEEAGPAGLTEKWRLEGVSVDSSVVVANDGTIFAIDRKVLKAISQLGKVLWTRSFDESLSPPTLSSEGNLYLATTLEKKSYVIAVDAATGKTIWKAFHSPGVVNTWHSHINLGSDGTVYVATAHRAAAYSPGGVIKWQHTFLEERYWNHCNTGPSLSPDEDTVYVFRRCSSGLYAFNTGDGTVKWHDNSEYKSDHVVPVVGRDGTVYIADQVSSTLIAYWPNGKKKFKSTLSSDGEFPTFIAMRSDGILIVTMQKKGALKGGGILAVSPDDGRVIWRYEIPKDDVGPPIAIDGRGKVYYGAGDGYVYLLDAEGRLEERIHVVTEDAKPKASQIHGYAALSDGLFFVISSGADVLHVIGSE